MKMFHGLVFLIILGCSQKENKQNSELIDRGEDYSTILDKAVDQYKVLRGSLPEDRFPKTFEGGELVTSNSGWWCSGFYPGSLLFLYEQTGQDWLIKEATRMMRVLEKEQFNTGTHDLGFMMFCSFGKAYQKNPTPEIREILINSAKSLSSRFNSEVGCIRSWNSKPDDFIVIIDNMMNLELLFWATEQTGDSTYYDIAVEHANTTMKNHFRSDFSSYHVLNYDTKTGEVKEKKTAQGYSDNSAWARGQAWGLYGYTMTYRCTKDQRYLEIAKNIADFLLDHPNLPTDKIPYWDFNAPNIPDAKRDASAAAITASALLELKDYVDESRSQEYQSTALKIIENLSTSKYLAEGGQNGGFILKHGVGHMPQGTEIDVPLTYADYYYLESIKRLMANK